MISLRFLSYTGVLLVSFAVCYEHAHGYGTGRETTTRSPPPFGHEHDHDGQWGGTGFGKQPGSDEDDDHHGSHEQGPNDQRYLRPKHTESSDKYKGPSNFEKKNYRESYGYPKGCTEDPHPDFACNYQVTISRESEHPDEFHFELSARLEEYKGGYVAVGLSKDKRMGEDHIVECIKLDNSRDTQYYQSWSTGRWKPERLQSDTSVIKMDPQYPNYKDGVLRCNFLRPIKTTVEINGERKYVDLVKDKYYIMLVTGNLDKVNSDEIGFHGQPKEKRIFVSEDVLGYDSHGYYYGAAEQIGFALPLILMAAVAHALL